MTHEELVALIRPAIPHQSGIWADVGAGTGNFTRALSDLLPDNATIYALDRETRALDTLRRTWRGRQVLNILHADFTLPLDLPALDGILMANALHFVRDPQSTLARLAGCLRPGGRFVLVEYDVTQPHSYIPYPVPLARFEALAMTAGLASPALVGSRRSPSNGVVMFAALAFKALPSTAK